VVGSFDGWPGVSVVDKDGFRVGFRVVGRNVVSLVGISDGISVGCGDGFFVGLIVG
jgi:hypothetical protein